MKTVKAEVEKYQTRIKYTSTSLIVIGAVGMAVSFYKMMTAGKHADHMINGHHGRPHHPHHPHNRTEEMKPEGPKYVTHEQFELYDTLKTLASIFFFIFAKVCAIGKCGKMMVWRNRVGATHRLGKKSCLGFVLVLLMSLYAAHEGHHVHMIMEKVHRNRPHHQGDEMKKFGRHLEESLVSQTQKPLLMTQLLKDDQSDCEKLSSETSCNAQNTKCSWCKAGAVADACNSIENAKRLPAAVFQCSNLGAEEKKEEKPVEIVKDDEDTCSALGDEDGCNSNDVCSWCKAGAVADACHSIENAKRLPAAVFQCSKLEVKDDQADCEKLSSETSCNAQNTKCSWCKAGAVADACNSIENAKRLPAAVFQCSNLGFPARERLINQAEKMIENAMEEFDRMATRFDRIPDVFQQFSETPQETCENSKDATSCKSAGCSWCDAAAVKPACNSISNAGKLPAAVFTCNPLPSAFKHDQIEEEFEEEEEEEPESLWGQFVNNMHGGRRGRHHEGRPHQGGRHHEGRPHHGGRHQRGERPPPPPMMGPPPMMEDEEESFYGRPPMGPRVRSERGPSEGHHGKHGKHGRHGRHAKFARLGRLMHVLSVIFAVTLFGGHFYNIKCLKNAQVAEEKICGKKECGWKQWKKNKCGRKFQQPAFVAQQPVVVEYSPVVQNTINSESSIEEISEDKEIGIVYAPNPTGIQSNHNQMV